MIYQRFLSADWPQVPVDDAILKQIAGDTSFKILKELRDAGTGTISIQKENRIQLGYGTTQLAELRFRKGSRGVRIDLHWPRELNVSVDKLDVSDLKDRASRVSNLIERAKRGIKNSKRYLLEGAWQDKLCQIGAFAIPGTNRSWLVIDREAVLAFESDPKKEMFWEPIKRRQRSDADAIHGKHSRWAKFGGTGDECDLLALSDQGELGCWEVKDCSNSDLEWAPLQARAYREAFEEAAPTITAGIKEMVRQKVHLGLLPARARDYLPEGVFKKVDAAVVVGFGSPKYSEEKVRRLRLCSEEVGPSIRILRMDVGGELLSVF